MAPTSTARQAYTLSFDGEPHPQQGYHVKLTVNTPYSHGSDKKSKVFWVEPCDSDTETTPGAIDEDADDDAPAPDSEVLPGAEQEPAVGEGETTPGGDETDETDDRPATDRGR